MNIKQIQELFVENINQNSKICTAFMQFVKLFSCNRLMFSVVLVISELLSVSYTHLTLPTKRIV